MKLLADTTELETRAKERFYYPGASQVGGRDGLWVLVQPRNRDPWMGVFSADYDSPPAISALCSYPDPRKFCAVSAGFGCIVDAELPSSWEKVKCFPILDLRVVVDENIILVSDFTRLAAYGHVGMLWITEPICWDGLQIKEITGTYVAGVGWNAVSMQNDEFKVDLKTGNVLKAPRLKH